VLTVDRGSPARLASSRTQARLSIDVDPRIGSGIPHAVRGRDGYGAADHRSRAPCLGHEIRRLREDRVAPVVAARIRAKDFAAFARRSSYSAPHLADVIE